MEPTPGLPLDTETKIININTREADCVLPGLNGAEESVMMEGNMEGFISCIGRGVNGVNVPPRTGCFHWKSHSVNGEVNNRLERLEGSQASMFWTWLKTFRQILFDCSFCGKFTMGKRPFGGARLDDVIFFQRCNLRGKIGPN